MKSKLNDALTKIREVTKPGLFSWGFSKRQSEATEIMRSLFQKHGGVIDSMRMDAREVDRFYPETGRLSTEDADRFPHGTAAVLLHRKEKELQGIMDYFKNTPVLALVLAQEVENLFDDAVLRSNSIKEEFNKILTEVERGTGNWKTHGDRARSILMKFHDDKGSRTDFQLMRDRAYKTFGITSFWSADHQLLKAENAKLSAMLSPVFGSEDYDPNKKFPVRSGKQLPAALDDYVSLGIISFYQSTPDSTQDGDYAQSFSITNTGHSLDDKTGRVNDASFVITDRRTYRQADVSFSARPAGGFVARTPLQTVIIDDIASFLDAKMDLSHLGPEPSPVNAVLKRRINAIVEASRPKVEVATPTF